MPRNNGKESIETKDQFLSMPQPENYRQALYNNAGLNDKNYSRVNTI